MSRPTVRTVERINLSFNPEAAFAIRKQTQSSEELVTFLKQLWQQISGDNSKLAALPLVIKPNVILQMKREKVPVHEIVLAAFSENCSTWSRMLTFSAKASEPYLLDLRIHAPSLTPEAIRSVMQFLYEGKTSFSMEILPQLLSASTFFGLSEIKQKCGEHILKFAKDDYPDVLMQMLQLSFTHDLPPDIKEKLVDKVAISFKKLLISNNGAELFNLSGEVMEALLSSDNLDAPDPVEYTIFIFIMMWLKEHKKEAPKYAYSLINTCRFDHMTTNEKFKCYGEARRCGIEHLVRRKIMGADWRKTCYEFGQPKKCDIPAPKRKGPGDTPCERRVQAKNEVPTLSEDNAVRSDNATNLDKTLPNDAEEGENSEEREARERKEEKRVRRVRGKNEVPMISEDDDAVRSDDETNQDNKLTDEVEEDENSEEREERVRTEAKRIRRENRLKMHNVKNRSRRSEKSKPGKEKLRRKDEERDEKGSFKNVDAEADLRTAEELVATTPQSTPISNQIFSDKKRKDRTRKMEPKELKDKLEERLKKSKSNRSGNQGSKLEGVVELFASMLNKKGRRMLQNRLMEPDFSDTFRNAVKGLGSQVPPVASCSSHVILKRDPHLGTSTPPSHGSGFLYSPESKDYKSYLEAFGKNIESRVGPKTSKRCSKNAVNGGKPVRLIQSVIHSKTNEIRQPVQTAYEQKSFPNAMEKSKKLDLNKIHLN